MVNLTPEAILKKIYRTYSSFYDIKLKGGIVYNCRRILQIVDIQHDHFEGQDHFPEDIEATFVLMNPGGAKPINNNYSIPTVPKSSINTLAQEKMTLTSPDKAQYQVMRLMQLQGWKKVQVINLSDIKAPKSKDFFVKVEEFERMYHDIHSIFSLKRKAELDQVLGYCETGPTILAWGTDYRLTGLAVRAIKVMPNRNIQGLATNLYYHASPHRHEDKLRWLTQMNSIKM
ncbi:hypothetical protein [Paenibacillus taichungensis]|uniref:hypothetical protein n=1 Tax=Paenibacillus taichungensis TaxID=484184 RepID=UPI0035D736B2